MDIQKEGVHINTLNEKCTLCGNRCYISNLKCKRGKNHYARLEAENKEKNIMKENEIEVSQVEECPATTESVTESNSDSAVTANEKESILEDDLTYLLMKTNHYLYHRKGSKRGQGKLLKILSKKGEMNQKELQELLGIESGSMSELVIKLEQKEFITRSKDEEDKRQTKVKITEQGLIKITEIQEKDKTENSNLYQGLTDSEQEELKTLLKKLHSGWKTIEYAPNGSDIREHHKCNCGGGHKGHHKGNGEHKHHGGHDMKHHHNSGHHTSGHHHK